MVVVLIASILFLFYPNTAQAYLDPGSGSYFIQIVLAAVLGSLLAIKIFFKNIVGFISRIFGRNEEKKSDTEENK